MKEVLLLRHERYDGAGYFGAGSDISLSERGKQRTEALVPVLSEFKPDHIYSSPMKRCRQTIAPFLDSSPESEAALYEELVELNFGEWEGKTYTEIRNTDKHRLNQWCADILNSSPPGGERLYDLYMRVTAFWQKKILQGPAGRYLIVTHGGPIRCILSTALKVEMEAHWSFRIDKGNFCFLSIHDDENIVINGLNLKAAGITEYFLQ